MTAAAVAVQARSSSPSSVVDPDPEGEADALTRADLRKQLKEFTINTQVGAVLAFAWQAKLNHTLGVLGLPVFLRYVA